MVSHSPLSRRKVPITLHLEPHQALALVERIGAAAILISSLEMIARRELLEAEGLLSWEAARLRSKWLTHGPIAFGLNVLFRAPWVLWLVGLRAFAAAVVIVSNSPPGFVVGVVALSTLLLMLRTSYGNDGADQIGLITFSAAALAHLRTTTTVIVAVLWFVTLQSCLAYLTSGVAKLTGSRWREGTGFVGILATKTYGMRILADVLRQHRWMALVASWIIILGESLFPVVLIAPPSITLGFMVCALVFHLGSAVVMGLNTFLWAFLATFPAIWYCANSWR
jgi:hypothetical protein